MFYNGLGKELSQKERRDHHRLARSAGRPDAKSCMVDSILFEKENDFCMTFGLACGQLTLRLWPIPLRIQAIFIIVSIFILQEQ